MISTQSQILELLKGASSKAPMPLPELVTKSGLLEATLLMILDSMSKCLPALVCSADITKQGTTTKVIWPTCVIEKPRWQDIVINPTKHRSTAALPPPRRHELTQKSETDMAAKFSALMIVKYVSQHPGISHNNLISQVAGEDARSQDLVKQMLYYCVKQNFLEARVVGGVKTYDLGLNEAWLAQHDLLPATKPKEPTESGVATTHSESAVKPAVQQTSPEAQASEVSLDSGDQSDAEGTASTAESTVEPQSSPEENIPSFIETPSLLPDACEAAEPILIGVDQGAGDTGAYGRFRLAYTDEGELMIFGVTFTPVELTTLQTVRLMEFLDSRYLKTIKHAS